MLILEGLRTLQEVSELLYSLMNIVISCLQIVVGIGLAYYHLLLAASRSKRQTSKAAAFPEKSFAIAIPAHDEEAVLAKTLKTLWAQDYPTHLYDIYVVADYCNDNTAEVASDNGAICYERSEGPRGRKAYPLRWLLDRILRCEKDYDALVIFDADSQVDAGFLKAMNSALVQGHLVLQGKHVIANPQISPFSRLAAVDMRLNNLLRNQAKQNLGLSCRLMGDAMCFATHVIRQHGWLAGSLVEDREYGLYLLTQGIHSNYIPEAVSCGQAAPSWGDASKQRLRWYGGVFQIQKRFMLRLLIRSLKNGDWAALDHAVELLLPSFSLLALLSLGLAAIQWMWPAMHPLFPTLVSSGVALAWILFPFLALLADGAPASAYGALIHSPFYLLWRLWLGLRARVQGEHIRWMRTRRREEIAAQIQES